MVLHCRNYLFRCTLYVFISVAENAQSCCRHRAPVRLNRILPWVCVCVYVPLVDWNWLWLLFTAIADVVIIIVFFHRFELAIRFANTQTRTMRPFCEHMPRQERDTNTIRNPNTEHENQLHRANGWKCKEHSGRCTGTLTDSPPMMMAIKVRLQKSDWRFLIYFTFYYLTSPFLSNRAARKKKCRPENFNNNMHVRSFRVLLDIFFVAFFLVSISSIIWQARTYQPYCALKMVVLSAVCVCY